MIVPQYPAARAVPSGALQTELNVLYISPSGTINADFFDNISLLLSKCRLIFGLEYCVSHPKIPTVKIERYLIAFFLCKQKKVIPVILSLIDEISSMLLTLGMLYKMYAIKKALTIKGII